MTRTISCAAAISLALVGSLFAAVSWGLRAAASRSPAPLVSLAYPYSERDPLKGPAGRTAPLEARAPADGSLVAVPALPPRVSPVARPVEPPGRPELRPFWATGPLVARVSDLSFGPRPRPDDLLTPRPPATFAGASDLLCIAVAIYHEARNQPLDGQLAVASVILNRTKEPKRWGSTPCEVVAPVQFSFMTGPTTFPPITEPEPWAIAVEMAREALERGPSPLVGQADHYHTSAVEPVWDNKMEQVITIDDHVFFIDPLTRG